MTKDVLMNMQKSRAEFEGWLVGVERLPVSNLEKNEDVTYIAPAMNGHYKSWLAGAAAAEQKYAALVEAVGEYLAANREDDDPLNTSRLDTTYNNLIDEHDAIVQQDQPAGRAGTTRVLFAVSGGSGGEEHFFPEIFRANKDKTPDYIVIDGVRFEPTAEAR